MSAQPPTPDDSWIADDVEACQKILIPSPKAVVKGTLQPDITDEDRNTFRVFITGEKTLEEIEQFNSTGGRRVVSGYPVVRAH